MKRSITAASDGFELQRDEDKLNGQGGNGKEVVARDGVWWIEEIGSTQQSYPASMVRTVGDGGGRALALALTLGATGRVRSMRLGRRP